MRNVNKKHIIKILLLVLFGCHYANITMFYHVHERNGKFIAHSHIWIFGESSKTELPTHTHTDIELKTIQQLNILQTNDEIPAIMLPQPSLVVINVFDVCNSHFQTLHQKFSYPLRGPPMV